MWHGRQVDWCPGIGHYLKSFPQVLILILEVHYYFRLLESWCWCVTILSHRIYTYHRFYAHFLKKKYRGDWLNVVLNTKDQRTRWKFQVERKYMLGESLQYLLHRRRTAVCRTWSTQHCRAIRDRRKPSLSSGKRCLAVPMGENITDPDRRKTTTRDTDRAGGARKWRSFACDLQGWFGYTRWRGMYPGYLKPNPKYPWCQWG